MQHHRHQSAYQSGAPQTISFSPPSSTAYGASPITLSADGGGSGNPIVFSVVSGPGSISGNTLTITGAGTIQVAANQAGNANYLAATQVTKLITVNKAVLTVTANNASKTYGAANPTFTPSYSGFQNGDTTSVLSGSPSLTTTATTSSSVGSYAIAAAVGSLSATNYSFTFTNGTLTIGKAALTVTANNANRTYGGTRIPRSRLPIRVFKTEIRPAFCPGLRAFRRQPRHRRRSGTTQSLLPSAPFPRPTTVSVLRTEL